MSLHRSILPHRLHESSRAYRPASGGRFSAGPARARKLGLFGEVGSIMATAKKFHREKEAYVEYRHAVEVEFGDTPWYFAALCRRLNVHMDEILAAAASGSGYPSSVAANDLIGSPISHVATPLAAPELDPN